MRTDDERDDDDAPAVLPLGTDPGDRETVKGYREYAAELQRLEAAAAAGERKAA